MTVALVIVSHSHQIALGTKDLAQAMAPDVHIGASGGNPDGGLGTSFDMVEAVGKQAALAAGDSGVVFLTDIGSATLTVDTVMEFAEDPGVYALAVGPLVEGAVVAATAAQTGATRDEVVRAVADAAKSLAEEALLALGADDASEDAPKRSDAPVEGEAEAVVFDAAGLHARPCARLARLASKLDTQVWVNGVSAASVMELMSLGANKGDTVHVTASGPNAQEVAQQVADAISAGFDIEG